MKTRILIIILALILLASCATSGRARFQGRIDPISITNQDQFEMDCNACFALVRAEMGWERQDALNRGVGGAILGAGLGAAFAGIIGDSSWVGRGAGIGALSGGMAGMASTPYLIDSVWGNCMQNRGYKLLW